MTEPDLHHAVHESNQQIVEMLLKQGMSPNVNTKLHHFK